MPNFSDYDSRLKDAIERGYLDALDRQNSELVEQWAAHQKVESLLACLRGSTGSSEETDRQRGSDSERLG